MKHIKLFEQFIGENTENNEYGIASIYFDKLRRDHSRSSFIETWIGLIKNLLNGHVKQIIRSQFRTSRGDQFGLEFVDDLIAKGILELVKVGRTEFIEVSNKNKVKFKEQLEMFKNNLKGTLNFNDKSNVLTYELNVIDNTYDFNANTYIKDVEKQLKTLMSSYYKNTKTDITELDVNDIAKTNRYITNNIIARYIITITGKL